MKRAKSYILSLAALCAAAALAALADTTRQAAKQGLLLCAQVIVPSLFPFFVLTGLIVSMDLMGPAAGLLSHVTERLFAVSGEAATPLLLGLLGGYPVGAQSAAALYRAGRLSKNDAEQAALFCNNSGPGFLFGVLGASVLGSPAKGILLYCLHAAGAVITGVLLRRERTSSIVNREETNSISFSAALTKSVQQAGESAVSVCAFVVFFSVLGAFLQSLLPPATPLLLRTVLTGALELSNGADALRTAAYSPALTFVLSAFFVSFGGFSVLAQTASVLQQAGLSGGGLFRAKLLQGTVTAILAAVSLLLPGSFPAWAVVLSVVGVIFLLFLELRTGNPRRKHV